MAKAVLNPEALLCAEQPFVKVPFEQLRRSFRNSQKLFEKELSNLTAASNDLAGKAGSGAQLADVNKQLENMLDRLKKLKRKITESKADERMYTARSRARLNHLNELMGMKAYESPQYACWSRTRLDRILVDYMLREGLMKTAKQMAKEMNIEDFADIELFVQAQRVEDALRRRSCTEALQWCSEHKSALRKNKSALEFQLRLQEYVELVRARKLVDAIAYAKKYLVSWADAHMKEIQTAMGLLAFSPDTSCKPYMRLFEESRWDGLVRQFRADNYALNSLPNQPLLTLTLQAGLSALKTQQCYQPANQNFNCPVCATDTLGVLALHLPLSHHVNSNIVCRISGQIMNEDNPPMALPNGMVYSHKSLMELAANNDMKIICPRTGEVYDVFNLKKVFIS